MSFTPSSQSNDASTQSGGFSGSATEGCGGATGSTPNPAFERTRSGKPGLACISFWLKPGLPPRAAQRKR